MYIWMYICTLLKMQNFFSGQDFMAIVIPQKYCDPTRLTFKISFIMSMMMIENEK